MGAVFRATQLAMDRRVAVKLLKPHLTSDQAALKRFAHEARATLKVESPHAVKILDYGVTPHSDYYMVLEYLDGRTVQRELEIDGPFAPARVVHIARQALHALATAHQQGLIHRDVKPDNLLLMRVGDDPDYTKILDFGVAKLMQGAAGDPAALALTAAGMVFGTPAFMSPEQACGHALDGRSDLYSLAATMFVMLTGTALFEGKAAIELLSHHARTPPPRLAMVRPELAAYPALDDLLQRCLAKHPEHRPDSAAAMSELLAELTPRLAPPPIPRDRASPIRPAVHHASSYVDALRDTVPDSRRASEAAGVDPPLRTRRRRRGPAFWLGGVAIASLLGLAIGAAVRGTGPRSTSISTSIPEPRDRVAAAVPPDASAAGPGDSGIAAPIPRDRASPDRASPIDPTGGFAPRPAGRAVGVASPVTPGAVALPARRDATPARNPVAEDHLRNAEDAFVRNNQLKQLAEADLALQADPHSVRARYLLGDALIKGGDLDRGCTYLRSLRRNPAARDRARAAGCPGD